MIIDTSAALAILFAEEDADRFAEAVTAASRVRMSAANHLAAAIVIDNQLGIEAGRQFDRFLSRAGVEVEPITREHADTARQAYLDCGKGRHPARLNFGGRFASALARVSGERLLYNGDDFSRTHVVGALEP